MLLPKCLMIRFAEKSKIMNVELKEVHVGHIIRDRIAELGMSKSEFGRLVGIPQQHVNRVLERETMETKKLVKVCQALDINIFSKFCVYPTNVGAYLYAVAQNGYTKQCEDKAALLAQVELLKLEITGLKHNLEMSEEMVEVLKSRLEDKDHIISLLKR